MYKSFTNKKTVINAIKTSQDISVHTKPKKQTSLISNYLNMGVISIFRHLFIDTVSILYGCTILSLGFLVVLFEEGDNISYGL